MDPVFPRNLDIEMHQYPLRNRDVQIYLYIHFLCNLSLPVGMNLTQLCLVLLVKMNLNINLSNIFWIDYRTLHAIGYFAIIVLLYSLLD